MTEAHICPSCETAGMSVFYRVEGVPAHSVLLLETREEAVSYPTGDIDLAFCPNCGFIANVAFDPALNEYDARYEATQGYSPTFNRFARQQAEHLITRYDLHGKDIIEIGCGQGEFLTLLCELGGNRGVGFDPAYRDHDIGSPAGERLTFIPDFYSEEYADYQADFIVCRMTLEHIQPTAEFIRMVRRVIGDRHDITVFFQVPNAQYVLEDLAFWDVYYEHCSYFSRGSLARLFRRCGFDVLDLATAYDDQYLMIEARPSRGEPSPPLPGEEAPDSLQKAVQAFATGVPRRLEHWRQVLADFQQQGRRVVIWGGGSKGVAFLTTLAVRDAVSYVVDINPHKHGTFMAGTGQEIVGPAFLKRYQPDAVIVMNPVYSAEIQQDLDRLGVAAELLPV